MLELSHKKMEVYKIMLLLTKEVYRLTKTFPKEEQFGLVFQLRKAAVSTISNFAEGSARKSDAEKKRFYEISRSSVVEIDTQFELALTLEYVVINQIIDLEKYVTSVFRILCKMITKLGG